MTLYIHLMRPEPFQRHDDFLVRMVEQAEKQINEALHAAQAQQQADHEAAAQAESITDSLRIRFSNGGYSLNEPLDDVLARGRVRPLPRHQGTKATDGDPVMEGILRDYLRRQTDSGDACDCAKCQPDMGEGTEPTLRVGAVVRLKLFTGPKMTVNHIGDKVETVWFTGNDAAGWVGPYKALFAADALEVLA